jgi:5'-methylthioadenosine phosphorylase
MTKATLGIIGGSGIYDLPGIEDVLPVQLSTPWGEHSDGLRTGRVGATRVVFLPRHGRGHRIPPHEINYRANIDALKQLGVTDLVSFSACGSYKETLSPGTFVLVDNFVDRTVHRAGTFFGTGCVAHVSFAHPVGPALQDRIEAVLRAEAIAYQRGGVAVCMEGPQFSTLPESLTYQKLGYDIIHMTSMPEAKLAREAEITYAVVAMVTDYDCWHEAHGAVDVASLLRVMAENNGKAQRVFARLAREFPAERIACPVGSHCALDGAILTHPEVRDPALVARLQTVAGRVLHPPRAG